jgi:hypothetical protein
MKIVAANHADSLRRPCSRDSAEATVLDIVREGLRSFYGEGDDELPGHLTELVHRLDRRHPQQGFSA